MQNLEWMNVKPNRDQDLYQKDRYLLVYLENFQNHALVKSLKLLK